MTRACPKILARVETILLLAGCAATGLAVNGACLQPFRDEKEALLIWIGGALGALGAWRGICGVSDGRRLRLSLLLLPVLGIAVWRLVGSLESEGGFGTVEPGLPAKTDYLNRVLAPPLAAFFFWKSARRQKLTARSASWIGTVVLLLGVILTVGTFVEVLGDRFGFDCRPFLLGAVVETGQGALKANYFGSIGNSNFLAGYLAILSFAGAGYALASKGILVRMFGGFLFLGMLTLALLCRSKGALAGFGLGLLFYFAAHLAGLASKLDGAGRIARRVGVSFGVCGILLVVVVGITLSSPKRREDFIQVARLRGESLSQRILLGYVGLEMWKESSWFGVGPGEFGLTFLDRIAEILNSDRGEAFASRVERLKSFKPVHVHNDYLEVLIEWGAIGYLSCAAFLVANLWMGWKSVRGSDGSIYGLKLGALSGVGAALGYATFEFPFFLPSHLALIATLLGLSIAPIGREEQFLRKTRFLGRATAALLLLVSAFLLWHGTARALATGLAGEATRLVEGNTSERTLALRNVRRAASLDPGYADLVRLEALFAWRIENRPDLAVRALRRGAPYSDDPLFELMEAQIHLEENRLREAAESLSPLLAVAPYLPGVGYLEGRIHESQGDLEKAKEAYARDVRATRSRPEIRHIDPPHLYLRYGSVLERLGYYREAVWQYEEIADLESNQPLALLRLGRLFRDRFQDLPTAEEYFEKAMSSAQRTGNRAEEEAARKEILELKRMREQMRKDAVLIEELAPDEMSPTGQEESGP